MQFILLVAMENFSVTKTRIEVGLVKIIKPFIGLHAQQLANLITFYLMPMLIKQSLHVCILSNKICWVNRNHTHTTEEGSRHVIIAVSSFN